MSNVRVYLNEFRDCMDPSIDAFLRDVGCAIPSPGVDSSGCFYDLGDIDHEKVEDVIGNYPCLRLRGAERVSA